MCEKRLNNGYETHQTAFDSMIGHIGQYDRQRKKQYYEKRVPLNLSNYGHT